MTTLALDISNYSSDLTPDSLAAWKDEGVGLVIVQAVDPPAGYPAGKTRAQIQACLDAGLAVDSYIWLWFQLDVDDIRRKLTLLNGLSIRRIFLDIEDTAAKYFDQVVCEQKVQAALDACDAWHRAYETGERTGIYTAHWFWTPSAYMNNSEVFKDRDLWTANYDSVADTSAGFVPYGGWDRCAVKQFQGTTTFHGVSGVDLNVLSADEAAKLNPEVDDVLIPDDYVAKFSLKDNRDVEGLIGNFEGVINTVREQANAQDVDCQARLQKVRDAVGT